jgi:hypothetical protein
MYFEAESKYAELKTRLLKAIHETNLEAKVLN